MVIPNWQYIQGIVWCRIAIGFAGRRRRYCCLILVVRILLTQLYCNVILSQKQSSVALMMAFLLLFGKYLLV
jgi:hypothetical protein